MNLTLIKTKEYENKTLSESGKNKPKQSQTNPNKSPARLAHPRATASKLF